MSFKRVSFLTHSAVNIYFNKNPENFVVNEIPLYEFNGEGEHLILHLRKKNLTTWQAISKLSEVSGAKVREFGYAGLKDKNALTTQYISIHKKYEESLKNFQSSDIKILNYTYHKNKIKTGHLKGNNFFIRFKKAGPVDAQKLSNALEMIKKGGMPNYFGYQRFGNDRDNFKIGKQILQGTYKERNRKKKDLFISAYQSHLFNNWLSSRIELCQIVDSFDANEISKIYNFTQKEIKILKEQKQFFKILPGDLANHYPYGKVFMCENIKEEIKRLINKEIVIVGKLPGKNPLSPTNTALDIQNKVYGEDEDNFKSVNGSFRFSFVYPQNIEYNYKSDKLWFEFSFDLPKGSYATTLIEEICGGENVG